MRMRSSYKGQRVQLKRNARKLKQYDGITLVSRIFNAEEIVISGYPKRHGVNFCKIDIKPFLHYKSWIVGMSILEPYGTKKKKRKNKKKSIRKGW